ncbi:MAG: MauE/DoxX family redox-associated membrane protein [Phycisphaerales bacterium JB038]
MSTETAHTEYDLVEEAPKQRGFMDHTTRTSSAHANHASRLNAAHPSAAATLGGACLLVLRLALAFVFLYSGIAKLLDPQEFLFAVKAFKMLPTEPDFLITTTTYTVPIAEVLCGVLLVIGLWTRGAALLLGVMLVGFTIGIFSVLLRGLSIDCGCFGQWLPAEITWFSPLRNLIIFAPALILTIWGGGLFAADGRRWSLSRSRLA